MPGIVGIVGSARDERARHMATGMLAAMYREPFYASGSIEQPELGVWAGWTAHEGSRADRQSRYRDADGLLLLLAGECWTGTRVAASGPADVLDEYRKHGDDFLGSLNGLFSGLLVDPVAGRVLLFNDRFSSERLYTCEEQGLVLFASEAKALLSVVPRLRAFDDEGVAQFLKYGTTLDERTLFSGVSLMPGGSLWSFEPGAQARKSQYFVPSQWESLPTLGEEEFEESLRDALCAVVPRYAATEECLGISITGGLDTRMIMACLPPQVTNAVCYTFGGLTGQTLDERIGRQVAEACRLEHRTLNIAPAILSGFREYLDRTVLATDGCAGATVVHEVFLNRLARDVSRVRLTGNFGSELLRSVSTLQPVGLEEELLDADFRSAVGASAAGYDNLHPVTRAAFKEIPLQLFGSLAAGRSQVTFRTPYLDNDIVRLAYQGSHKARHSPAAALALVQACRPALSRIPTDRGWRIGDNSVVSLARRSWASFTFKLDYLDKEGLPDWLMAFDPVLRAFRSSGLLGLHKYLPYRDWFRRDLADYLNEVVTDPTTREIPYFSGDFLRTMVRSHCDGRRNFIQEINAVLTLEAIQRLLLSARAGGSPPSPSDVRGISA